MQARRHTLPLSLNHKHETPLLPPPHQITIFVYARVCVCKKQTCVHACSACVCICIHAGVPACTRVRVRERACTFVCLREGEICAHRFACTYVCVCARAWGCVHAHVRRSVRVSFLLLHHLCPGDLQWGWLACPWGNPAHTQNLVLLYLLLNPCC
jgi:hypothetical protein